MSFKVCCPVLKIVVWGGFAQFGKSGGMGEPLGLKIASRHRGKEGALGAAEPAEL